MEKEQLLKLAKEYLDKLHEIYMGRAKTSDGKTIEYCDFYRGMNAAYVNIYNALNMKTKKD
jgi:hypothetical protein